MLVLPHSDLLQLRVISRAIIGLGHSLGMEVVAEGVESPEQLDFVLGEGCRYAQGYWFGRPAPLEQMNLAQRSLDVDFPPALQWARRSFFFSASHIALSASLSAMLMPANTCG